MNRPFVAEGIRRIDGNVGTDRWLLRSLGALVCWSSMVVVMIAAGFNDRSIGRTVWMAVVVSGGLESIVLLMNALDIEIQTMMINAILSNLFSIQSKLTKEYMGSLWTVSLDWRRFAFFSIRFTIDELSCRLEFRQVASTRYWSDCSRHERSFSLLGDARIGCYCNSLSVS